MDIINRILTAIIMLVAVTCACADTVPRLVQRVDLEHPQARRIDLWYGETIDIECSFRNYGETLDLTGAAVTLHAVTNGMAGSSYQVAGEVAGAGKAVVRVVVDAWLPQDLESVDYTLAVELAQGGRVLRAFGTAYLNDSAYSSEYSPVPESVYTALYQTLTNTAATADSALSIASAAQATADSASATGALNSAAIAGVTQALATQRVDKVWSSSSNYMDGDGIMYEIGTVESYLCTEATFAGGSAYVGSRWYYAGNDMGHYLYTNSLADTANNYLMYGDAYDVWAIYVGAPGSGEDFASAVSSRYASPITLYGDSGLHEIRFARVTVETNVIDRVVTTNGSVIIIGSAADSSGSTTQLTARAGSETVTYPFVGQDDLAEIPRVPTNSVVGWLMFDAGSNMWLRVSVSNLSFTVEEVEL